MNNNFVLSTVIQVLDKATKPLQQIGMGFGKLTKKLGPAAAQMGKVGKSMDSAGKILTTRLTLPLLAAGGLATKFSFDFNEAMSNVATLIPGNLSRVQELKKGVQDLSIDMGKTTDDMAGGLYQVISAFGDTSDTMKILKLNAKAATAGMATTTDAINLTSAVTKGYGDTTAEAVKKASDLAFVTVKLGQTTFPELAASIGRVVPLAAQLQVSQEELFAGFATLTGVTGSAAEVSTQMAAIMRAMLKPTEDMKKVTKELGFESTAQMLKQKGLVESLKLLMRFTEGNEEATAKLFGRAEALTAVFSLAGPQADTFAKKMAEMQKATGATDDAFKEITDGINKSGFSWKQFLSLLKVLGQEIGDVLGPVLVEVAGTLRGYIQTFRNLSPSTKKNIVMFVAMAAALGPVLRIFGKLFIVIGKLHKLYKVFTFAQKLLNIAMAANPVGLVITGLIVLAALIVIMIKNWDKFGASLSVGLGPLGMLISQIKTLYDRWDDIKKAFKSEGIIQGLKEIGKTLADSILYPIQQLLENLAKIPGIGKFAKSGSESLKKFREKYISAGKGIPNASTVNNLQERTKKVITGEKNQSEITVKVVAEAGTSATIDKIKNKGKTKPKISNSGFLGNILQFAQ